MPSFPTILVLDRLNFSGGLGIHSDGDLLPRVGAPSMNSFSASESLDSSSITYDTLHVSAYKESLSWRTISLNSSVHALLLYRETSKMSLESKRRDFYLLLQPYNWSPLLLQEASIFPFHLSRHIGFFLECLQCILIAIRAKVIRDRLISKSINSVL